MYRCETKLGGRMAEEEAVTVAENTDVEVTTPDTEQASDETSTEDVAAEATDEPEAEPEKEKPKVDLKQRKIAKQARDIREMKRQNAQLSEAVRVQAETASKAQSTGNAPKIEDFESMDAYLDARDSHRDSSREAKQEQRQEPDYNPRDDLFDAGTEKYEDFEDIVFGSDVRISAGMADAIFEIDDMNLQADVAYFLGQNPKESAKIAKLSDRRQVAEIAKLEVKLSTKPSAKKQASKAPSPIKPVGGSKTSNDAFVEGETYSAFLKKRNKQLGR